ncbi:hypothetical protein FH972_015406 [Carpinus fangiana]|uniref:Uncharacterized protein n=1 Tax=Carpinus fangiana TaxID=176857 RepID=A0A5N6RD92_9ROSI|nr:hypothetical protein FH972_015406 [Carpinus fangiana]
MEAAPNSGVLSPETILVGFSVELLGLQLLDFVQAMVVAVESVLQQPVSEAFVLNLFGQLWLLLRIVAVCYITSSYHSVIALAFQLAV